MKKLLSILLCALLLSCSFAAAETAGESLFSMPERGILLPLTEEDLNSYVRFANKAASITTSRPGAIPAMPTLKEVEESL